MADFDVAIIGAGIAGQICANYVARDGKRVVLLEQNHQAGGNMSGFSRQGYYFDGGDQSFESLGIVFPILQELGVYDKLEWIKARYRMVSTDFDFYIDSIEGVEEALQAAFPAEPGIKPLFKEIKEVSRFLQTVCTPWHFPLLHDFKVKHLLTILPWLTRLKRWSTFKYRETACRVIRTPQLRNWLTTIGYYKMPYAFFAGFWHLWSQDYWYPKGGMRALHQALMDNYTAAGGEVHYNTLITEIITKGNISGNIAKHRDSKHVLAVRTAKGREITADTFVYAGDYRRLVNMLLKSEAPVSFKPKLVKKIESCRLTEALVSVYLGLDMSDTDLSKALGAAQHPFYFPNYDVIFPDADSPLDVHSRMWLAFNHFGLESPAAPPGKSALTLQTYSSAQWQNCWRNGRLGMPRTQEYKELKQQVGYELVNLAENIIPGLSNRIDFMDVGSPLSLVRFTCNSEGASGGWCYQDTVSPVFRLPGLNITKTPLNNLYACGHYALWPGGVISAALCGKITANLISKRKKEKQ